MKTYSRLTLAFLLLILVVQQVGADEPPESGEEVTVWSDSSGKFKIFAFFVELVDGNLVVLKRASDGKVIKVPLDKLDDESKSQAKDLHADAKAQPKNGQNKAGDPAGNAGVNDAKRPQASDDKHVDEFYRLWHEAVKYFNAGNIASALKYAKESLAYAELYKLENKYIRSPLEKIGHCYLLLGQPNEAEKFFERELYMQKEILGPDAPGVAATLIDLTNVYSAQGNDAKAESQLKQVLTSYKKSLGPDHEYIATALNNLGGIYYRQRKYALAEKHYKQALKAKRKLNDPTQPHGAYELSNLGVIYEKQRKYALAERCYKESLAIRKKGYEPDHPAVVQMLKMLAKFYRKTDREAEAEKLEKQAAEIEAKQAFVPPNRLR